MTNGKKERCVLTSVIETELDILKRHIHVLLMLQKNQPMGIIKLSELTNYPQHMVRYSLRILEQDGLIEPSPHGAVVTEKVGETMKLLERISLYGSREVFLAMIDFGAIICKSRYPKHDICPFRFSCNFVQITQI